MKKPHFQRITPSFQSRGRKTHEKSAMVKPMDESLGRFGSWREEMESDFRTGRKRSRTEEKIREMEEDDNGGSFESLKEENNEKEEVDRKIEELQRIVPGGDGLGPDKLFEKTAGYVLSLQRQLEVLTTLSVLFERLDKEKTKFGG